MEEQRKKDNYNKRKGDDAMSAAAKPRTGAFVLRAEKSGKFLAQEKNMADKTIERFKAHRPKNGIVSPFKK